MMSLASGVDHRGIQLHLAKVVLYHKRLNRVIDS
jgi:hypothetical protein